MPIHHAERSSRATLALSLLALGGCGSGGGPALHAGPNVLLITIDTLRADHLSCYGYPRPTSPNIDALAADGLLFERAHATSGSTLPSHLSILTGLLPHQHGFLSNVRALEGAFQEAPGCESAASTFSRAGWTTAAFISGNTIKKVTGVNAGFAVFNEPQTRNRTADLTCARALGWLQRHLTGDDPAPFFLWVHFWDVHEPNDPPEPHRSLFRPEASVDALIAARRVDPSRLQAAFSKLQVARMFHPQLSARLEAGEDVELPPLEAADVRRLYDMYDGSVHFVDHNVGRLLKALERFGASGRTLVALTADHGQALGQHDWLEHGRIQGEIVHVPLIMRLPGTGIPQPQRIERVVSTVDILPTLVARLAHPAFAPFMEQASGSDLFSGETPRGWTFSHRTTRWREWEPGEKVAVGTERWRFYHFEGGSDELFDLADDPGELVDVLEQHPEAAASFRSLVRGILETRADAAGETRELSDEERAALEADLRAAGYLGDEEDEEDENR